MTTKQLSESVLSEQEFIARVTAARDFAEKAHAGQKRKDGEPYFTHVEAVAKIIEEEFGLDDSTMISAAYLHDTIEDNKEITYDTIATQFSIEIAELVDGVTKFTTPDGLTDDKETHKKVAIHTTMDPRVGVLKLADRLHNMRTLGPMDPEKQMEISSETLRVYTKLAEALGMWSVKVELEDLAFSYLLPEEYARTVDLIDHDKRVSIGFRGQWEKVLQRIAAAEVSGVVVISRKNGYWALNNKLRKSYRRGEITEEGYREINDVVSFRVSAPTIGGCFACVGLIENDKSLKNLVEHDRFDDFTGSNIRDNSYSVVSITLNTKGGAIEVAAATPEMEEFNNWGVVSLLRKGASAEELEPYVLKMIFTPKEAVFLPKNANGVDLAYYLNPMLGANAEKMQIDGVEASIETVIPAGAEVFVISSEPPSRFPKANSPDGNLRRTGSVREKQRKIEMADKRAAEGESMLEEVLLDRALISLNDLSGSVGALMTANGCSSISEVHRKVRDGGIEVGEVARWIDEQILKAKGRGETWVLTSGVDRENIMLDISTAISENGGNIEAINYKKANNRYKLRMVISGLRESGTALLADIIAQDARYENWTVL